MKVNLISWELSVFQTWERHAHRRQCPKTLLRDECLWDCALRPTAGTGYFLDFPEVEEEEEEASEETQRSRVDWGGSTTSIHGFLNYVLSTHAGLWDSGWLWMSMSFPTWQEIWRWWKNQLVGRESCWLYPGPSLSPSFAVPTPSECRADCYVPKRWPPVCHPLGITASYFNYVAHACLKSRVYAFSIQYRGFTIQYNWKYFLSLVWKLSSIT